MEKRDKLVLTVKDVAAYLQVNQTTIYRLLRQSAIPAFKLGGDWRFNVESIDALAVGSRRRDLSVIAKANIRLNQMEPKRRIRRELWGGFGKR